MPIKRIISGGQSGVDRAALDVALERGILCGGWCPRGRKAEHGRIPDRYPMQETRSAQYAVRSKWNVRDSDGTLVLTVGEPSGGTCLTIEAAEQRQRPLLVLDLALSPDPQVAKDWIELHGIEVLNVAGPRESTAPGVITRAAAFLRELLEGIT